MSEPGEWSGLQGRLYGSWHSVAADHTAWALQMPVLHPAAVQQVNEGCSKSGSDFVVSP